jgi:hypothetical protein
MKANSPKWRMPSFATNHAAFTIVPLAALVCSCCCHAAPACPSPSGQKCALGEPGQSKLPRLFRSVTLPPAGARYANAPICSKPHSVSDECELIDDLQSIVGTGFSCQNGEDVAVGKCEGWSEAQPLQASTQESPPCGASACPNVSLVVRDANGAALKLTFYDDISCHRPPREANCQRSGRACYYRVYRVDHI